MKRSSRAGAAVGALPIRSRIIDVAKATSAISAKIPATTARCHSHVCSSRIIVMPAPSSVISAMARATVRTFMIPLLA
jgi:hypothetical protein